MFSTLCLAPSTASAQADASLRSNAQPRVHSREVHRNVNQHAISCNRRQNAAPSVQLRIHSESPAISLSPIGIKLAIGTIQKPKNEVISTGALRRPERLRSNRWG